MSPIASSMPLDMLRIFRMKHAWSNPWRAMRSRTAPTRRIRAVKKSVQRGIETLEDIKDEGVHYVKRQPLKAIAMAAGAGLMVGMAAAWITGRFRQQRASQP